MQSKLYLDVMYTHYEVFLKISTTTNLISFDLFYKSKYVRYYRREFSNHVQEFQSMREAQMIKSEHTY